MFGSLILTTCGFSEADGTSGARTAYTEAFGCAEAREKDFTGRPLKGMVFVDADGLSDHGIAEWVRRGWVFVHSLPAK